MGVKPNQQFVLEDGTVIKNLYQLSQALDGMPEEIFNKHVNEEKNDFFNWVLEVHRDQKLASQLAASKTAKAMRSYINKKIKLMPPKKEEAKEEKKPVSVVKEAPAQKPDIMKKVLNVFKAKDKTKPDKPGMHLCPFKETKCIVIEFLLGVMVGLLIGLVIFKTVV